MYVRGFHVGEVDKGTQVGEVHTQSMRKKGVLCVFTVMIWNKCLVKRGLVHVHGCIEYKLSHKDNCQTIGNKPRKRSPQIMLEHAQADLGLWHHVFQFSVKRHHDSRRAKFVARLQSS